VSSDKVAPCVLHASRKERGVDEQGWVQVHKNGEAVRAPVALAVVKLLKHLPPAVMRAALPSSLQKVANVLRMRLQRIR
jgi:U3 small nucleolar RNA-associated protein 20